MPSADLGSPCPRPAGRDTAAAGQLTRPELADNRQHVWRHGRTRATRTRRDAGEVHRHSFASPAARSSTSPRSGHGRTQRQRGLRRDARPGGPHALHPGNPAVEGRDRATGHDSRGHHPRRTPNRACPTGWCRLWCASWACPAPRWTSSPSPTPSGSHETEVRTTEAGVPRGRDTTRRGWCCGGVRRGARATRAGRSRRLPSGEDLPPTACSSTLLARAARPGWRRSRAARARSDASSRRCGPERRCGTSGPPGRALEMGFRRRRIHHRPRASRVRRPGTSRGYDHYRSIPASDPDVPGRPSFRRGRVTVVSGTAIAAISRSSAANVTSTPTSHVGERELPVPPRRVGGGGRGWDCGATSPGCSSREWVLRPWWAGARRRKHAAMPSSAATSPPTPAEE